MRGREKERGGERRMVVKSLGVDHRQSEKKCILDAAVHVHLWCLQHLTFQNPKIKTGKSNYNSCAKLN